MVQAAQAALCCLKCVWLAVFKDLNNLASSRMSSRRNIDPWYPIDSNTNTGVMQYALLGNSCLPANLFGVSRSSIEG